MEKKTFKCDSLCIRYMNKECYTMDEENEMCDQPYLYREIGDEIDAIKERLEEF